MPKAQNEGLQAAAEVGPSGAVAAGPSPGPGPPAHSSAAHRSAGYSETWRAAPGTMAPKGASAPPSTDAGPAWAGFHLPRARLARVLARRGLQLRPPALPPGESHSSEYRTHRSLVESWEPAESAWAAHLRPPRPEPASLAQLDAARSKVGHMAPGAASHGSGTCHTGSASCLGARILQVQTHSASSLSAQSPSPEVAGGQLPAAVPLAAAPVGCLNSGPLLRLWGRGCAGLLNRSAGPGRRC